MVFRYSSSKSHLLPSLVNALQLQKNYQIISANDCGKDLTMIFTIGEKD